MSSARGAGERDQHKRGVVLWRELCAHCPLRHIPRAVHATYAGTRVREQLHTGNKLTAHAQETEQVRCDLLIQWNTIHLKEQTTAAHSRDEPHSHNFERKTPDPNTHQQPKSIYRQLKNKNSKITLWGCPIGGMTGRATRTLSQNQAGENPRGADWGEHRGASGNVQALDPPSGHSHVLLIFP